MWPISSPAHPPSDGQQQAQQSACANTRDAPATSTPGSLMCCLVEHIKTPSQHYCLRSDRHHMQPICWILGLLVPVDEEHHSHLILGVLLTLRYLMPLLQQQVNTISLKGSFGVMQKEADVQPSPEQLLQVLFTLLMASGLPSRSFVTFHLCFFRLLVCLTHLGISVGSFKNFQRCPVAICFCTQRSMTQINLKMNE